MAPTRRSRAGLAAGALALAVAVALAAYPAATAPRGGALLAAVGGGGVLVAGLAIAARVASLVPLALAFPLAEYAVALSLDADTAPPTPAMAAALLVAAELAYWAVEPRGVARSAGLVARRAAVVAGLGAGAAGLAVFLLGASEIARGGGLLLPALGVAAVVGALALLALLARARPA